uniref:Uncharacterized protein n=1 Tax=Rhizophagus irregularis (strain DAOM 181602 / DAOM 197198 / MUCL 43194) TaxID=747089 RepID=U9STZ7_RHIID
MPLTAVLETVLPLSPLQKVFKHRTGNKGWGNDIHYPEKSNKVNHLVELYLF